MELDTRLAWEHRSLGLTVSLVGKHVMGGPYRASRRLEGIQPAGFFEVWLGATLELW